MAKNELMKVEYETALGAVTLDVETVKQYLVKGNSAVSDKECVLFLKMCESQKLNPFVTGEVYLIKFGDSPAQMIIGYDTYKKRADDNPEYLYTESGIVVCRGSNGEIVQKIGACLYPTEQLIGGWCRVHKLKRDREVTTFKEVGFSEYNKGNAIWKEKPCTMIEKVAISQCLREAFPKDYEGLYTEEELSPAQYDTLSTGPAEIVVEEEDTVITQGERTTMFNKAYSALGKERANEVIKQLIENEGLTSTAGMKKSVYNHIMSELDVIISQSGETA